MKWNYLNNDNNSLIENIFINRNIDFKKYKENLLYPFESIYNNPLENIYSAIELINKYLNSNYNIYIFADYDCDGLTSGYIMYDFLKSKKDNVFVHFPSREEGYGLNIDYCKKIVKNNEKALVITVDNGTTCLEQVKYLQDNNIEVLITDHHNPGDILPKCIIVNPWCEKNSKNTHLSGCGVVFHLIAHIIEDVKPDYIIALMISTIADVMPMTLENQLFCQYGLDLLNNGQCEENFKSLREFFGGNLTITGTDIAWTIAPCINSCSRIGKIEDAVSFFLDKDNSTNVYTLQINNETRKKNTKKAEKIIDSIDYSKHNICFFDGTEYGVGMAGVIANKIADKNNKPAVVYNKIGDKLSCSIRSIEGLDILSYLNNEISLGNLLFCGGHEQACGASIEENKLEKLIKSLDKNIANNIELIEVEQEIYIEDKINFKDFNTIFDVLSVLIFDKNTMPEPIFSIENTKVKKFKYSKSNPNNVCFTLEDENKNTKTIWAWGMGDKYRDLNEPKELSIAGTLNRDFMNTKNITLKVVDFK